MTLTQELNNLARENGITHFGIADLSYAHSFILDQGGPVIADFPFSISLGITLPKAIVDQLPNRLQRSVAVNYRHHAYDIINQRLDHTASLLSLSLQQKGYMALPIPASKRVDDNRICAEFSHKLSAHLSGLGWIGKSCLLVTLRDGPRVRWATILTKAPLGSSGRPMNEICGDCTDCVDICPVKAFTGRPFTENEPREVRYDARKCDNYFNRMKSKGKIDVCGMCLYVCPYGM